MIEIVLRFRTEEDGLIGMTMETKKDNPEEKEIIIANQMIEYITAGGIRSPVVARGTGNTLEEAKKAASLERDIFNAGRPQSPGQRQ